MIDIKVRVWSIDMKKMICAKYINAILFASHSLRVKYEDSELGRMHTIENIEVLLFTGFRDKNGVEIYEGDILKYEVCYKDKSLNFNYQPGIVRWMNCSACFYAEWPNTDIDDKPDFHETTARNRMVIIGNIYENPELLGVKA